MDWKFVWSFASFFVIFSTTNAAPQPGEGLFGGGEMGDLFGSPLMANHVPRLGRRSMNPFKNQNRNGFRFFGANGDKDGSGSRTRNFAGYYGPLFRNFRFYGGSPTEELTRQLLREKRLEEFSNPAKGDAAKEDPKAEDFVDDDEFWRQSLAEATLNSVLEKMTQIGETKEMIEELENYDKYGSPGSPLPRFLARYNHQLPAMSPKVKVESSYPSKNQGLGYKFSQFRPFPRKK